MDSQPAPKRTKRWLWYSLSLCVIAPLALINLSFHLRARVHACENACINNLRQIDGAKEQWALENKKSEGTPVTNEDENAINAFIKGSGSLKCPSGDAAARYVYNEVGKSPFCTYNGGGEKHTLR